MNYLPNTDRFNIVVLAYVEELKVFSALNRQRRDV